MYTVQLNTSLQSLSRDLMNEPFDFSDDPFEIDLSKNHSDTVDLYYKTVKLSGETIYISK